MKRILKKVLQKWPLLFRMVRGIYYVFHGILEVHILGTRFQEWAWKNRTNFHEAKNIREAFLESLDHPHRKLLIEKIQSYRPVQSVMEIGCGMGTNLCLLASQSPAQKLFGIDISKKAVAEGKKIIAELKIDNVSLACGKADTSLSSFADKSVDILFTDAFLLYIGPDKIYRVLEEMLRIARKAVIFCEWHSEASNGGAYIHEHWVYNYPSLLSKYVPAESVKLTKITRELWDNDVWCSLGHVVEWNVANERLTISEGRFSGR